MNSPRLETRRLILETTTLDHAPFLRKIMNTPQYLQNVGDRKIRTDQDARNYIEERMLPQLERHGHTNFIIIDKASGQAVGLCGLYLRAGLPHPDLGFALLPDFQKTGLAREASEKLLEFGFEHLAMETVLAITLPENTASVRLLERLNFKCTGTVVLPGENTTLLQFRLDKNQEEA